MTPNDLATEALRLAEDITAALRSRYRDALAFRRDNPGRPLPAHLFAALADYQNHVSELHRISRLDTERGRLRALKALHAKVTT